MKLVLIMMLLITSLMAVVGTFLMTRVSGFYINSFYEQMNDAFGELPESEMKAVGAFDTLPENLTYPQVTPRFFKEAEELFRKL
jgi:hypothetical protein